MRRFFLLIGRLRALILFVILEIVCIYFIARSRSMQGLAVINSANSVVAYFYAKEQKVVTYFNLKSVNEQLLVENTELRKIIYKTQGVDTFHSVHARIPVVDWDAKNNKKPDSNATASPIGVTLRTTAPVHIIRYANYHFIPARVINNSVSNDFVNYITINRGSSSGIAPNMAVISAAGIVGRVEKVSKHFATIASVLSNRRVSVRLRFSHSFGHITWTPGDPDLVQMSGLPVTMPVVLNDSVFTTGYSYFPANILVGTVHDIDTLASNNTLLLNIRLATNFRALNFVYVVGNNMSKEKETLEKKDLTND